MSDLKLTEEQNNILDILSKRNREKKWFYGRRDAYYLWVGTTIDKNFEMKLQCKICGYCFNFNGDITIPEFKLEVSVHGINHLKEHKIISLV